MFFSSKPERATFDSVAFRFVASNQHPDHDTITALRRRFLPRIEAQPRAEVADRVDVPDGMSIPDELARREERLARIAQAKATIAVRAKERHACKQAAYDTKLAERDAEAAKTGRNPMAGLRFRPSGSRCRAARCTSPTREAGPCRCRAAEPRRPRLREPQL